MPSKLIVKNFGPILYAEIEFKDVTVFIGPQASGKSTLAKIFAICNNPERFLKKIIDHESSLSSFYDVLEEYNIKSYLSADTEFIYTSTNYNIQYKNQSIDHNIGPHLNFNDRIIYVPSERSLTNIIRNATHSLLLNNVPIPKHILLFGAEIEKIASASISMDIIEEGMFYQSINGEDYILLNEQTKHTIKLLEAASGIQSLVPLMKAFNHPENYMDNDTRRFHLKRNSFVIEEPELNIFPLSQYKLIQKLEQLRTMHQYNSPNIPDFVHVYTTHSPYILSAMNNLLYADKVLKKHQNNTTKRIEVLNITKASIDISSFSAYELRNGTARSIVDNESGLICDNYIDEVSDEMAEDFESLMEMMK